MNSANRQTITEWFTFLLYRILPSANLILPQQNSKYNIQSTGFDLLFSLDNFWWGDREIFEYLK